MTDSADREHQYSTQSYPPDGEPEPPAEPAWAGAGGYEPPAPQPESPAPESYDYSQVPAPAVATYTEEQPVVLQATPVARRSVLEILRSGDRPAMAKLFDRWARGLFATAIFLVPLVFDPRTVDAFNLVKLTTLWTLGVLAAGAWWYASHLTGRGFAAPRSRLLRLSLVLLGITAAATLFSPNRTISIFGLYHRYEGLISIAMYVGVVALIAVLYRKRVEALDDLAAAIGAAGGIIGFYIVLQNAGIDVSQWRQVTGAAPRFPIGTLGNSAFSASYLGIAAPFVLYRLIASQSFVRRFAWLVGAVFVVLGLWITQGRAGLLGAAAGILALLLFASRVAPTRKVALVVLTLVALVLTPVLFGDPTDPAQRGVLRSGTAGYRVQIWDASMRMFLNRPILGWGPESFFGQYPRFRTPDEARKQGLAITDKPHNIYLGWATATGIAGLLTWLLLLFATIGLVVQRAVTQTRARRMMAAAFGGGLVAYMAQGVYSIDVPPLALLGWVCVGAIAVLLEGWGRTKEEAAAEAPEAAGGARPAGGRRFETPDWLRRSWVTPAIAAIVLLFLLATGFAPVRADHAAWAAERRAPAGWSADTMALYEKAIDLSPRESAYRGLTASYMERVAKSPAAPFSPEDALRRSASLYLDALRIQPRNVYFMINVARVYAKLGKKVDLRFFTRGDRYLGQAVSLDPLDPQMHDVYADFLNKWQKKLTGQKRRSVLTRAQTQAGIAQQLREGQVFR